VDPQAALEQQALEELRRGDLKGAHRTLSVLLQHRPDDVALQRRIQQVEHLVQQRESRIQAEPLRYAHAYIQAGRLAEGLQLLRSALARDPQNQRLRELALEVARRLKDQVQGQQGPLTPGAGHAGAKAPGSSPAAPPMQGFGPAPGQAAPSARIPGSSPAHPPVPMAPAFTGAPYAGAQQAPSRLPPKAAGVDPAIEAKARQEVALRRDADERARKEALEKSKRESEERARREAEVRARQDAEDRAKRDAAEKARREAEERARREAEERARREAEERARREAEERARREAEERLKREAAERARREAEARAQAEREAEDRRQKAERDRREAEQRAQAQKEQQLRAALAAPPRSTAGQSPVRSRGAVLETWLARIAERRRPRD
jgi:hypothetical protein